MPFEIHLKSTLYSELPNVGNVVTVDALTVNDGFIKVGSYYAPFDQIIYVKEV
jgi:hypothetical protein